MVCFLAISVPVVGAEWLTSNKEKVMSRFVGSVTVALAVFTGCTEEVAPSPARRQNPDSARSHHRKGAAMVRGVVYDRLTLGGEFDTVVNEQCPLDHPELFGSVVVATSSRAIPLTDERFDPLYRRYEGCLPLDHLVMRVFAYQLSNQNPNLKIEVSNPRLKGRELRGLFPMSPSACKYELEQTVLGKSGRVACESLGEDPEIQVAAFVARLRDAVLLINRYQMDNGRAYSGDTTLYTTMLSIGIWSGRGILNQVLTETNSRRFTDVCNAYFHALASHFPREDGDEHEAEVRCQNFLTPPPHPAQ